jgi:hypothetical protein
VRFVNLVAPEYPLQPHLVLAIMATEWNFNADAESPRNAYGLMQLMPRRGCTCAKSWPASAGRRRTPSTPR